MPQIATVDHLRLLRLELSRQGVAGLMVPSTDEYLSEFAQPFARRLKWTTGFRGSTGLAIVLRDNAALFVDGRYHAQARVECALTGIEVFNRSSQVMTEWLVRSMKQGGCLALDTRLHSYQEVQRLLGTAATQGISVVMVDNNPIDRVWGAERPAPPDSRVVAYPEQFAGLSRREKIARTCEWLRHEGHDSYLLADPEDVAWLLNIRTEDSLLESDDGWHTIPICLSRAVVDATGKVFWFVESSRLHPRFSELLSTQVSVIPPDGFEPFMEGHFRDKSVCANLRKTPYRFAEIAERVGRIADAPEITRWRWKKHRLEIQGARDGHFRDGQAVIRFVVWLKDQMRQGMRITELEAARKLTEFRRELPGFRGISMPVMSSGGASGALPHYIPSEESDRIINDHPIYWVDSGGQFYGCSTDNTVCIAVGKPEPRHILAHTLVVKGFIALATARFPAGISSTRLDTLARQHLWQEGMDYGHGTGHGVGNFMNIHEGPYITMDNDHPLASPMEEGMIVSNEPGYYADADFGIRVESHLVVVKSDRPGFLAFETISHLPIDAELLDETRLTPGEKAWLAKYHALIAEGYEDCLQRQPREWLSDLADRYRRMANSR